MHTIIIRRLWDGAVLGSGTVYAPDFRTNPRLLKGNDTRFDLEAEVGGFVLLVIGARRILRCEILEIRGPQELYLKTAFIQDEKEEVLPNLSKGASESLAAALTGTLYSLAPKHAPLDISKTVHSRLAHGGAACLFPEGIAHDQSDLLPLKSKPFPSRNIQQGVNRWASWCCCHGAELSSKRPDYEFKPCSVRTAPHKRR